MKKIRCQECGAIIAHENQPINDKGEISIMCNNRKSNGERCKTVNIINNKCNKMQSNCHYKLSDDDWKEKHKKQTLEIENLREKLRN